MNITAEPVELGNDDLTLCLLRCPECSLQLRTAVKSVGTLARLDLGELGDDVETFGPGEVGNGLALGFEAKATSCPAQR